MNGKIGFLAAGTVVCMGLGICGTGARAGAPDVISFEDLRASCQAWKDDAIKGGSGAVKQYPVKRPVIQCVDTFTTWVEESKGDGLIMPNYRRVEASLSDKALVVPVSDSGPFEAGTAPGRCARFKQVNERFSYNHPTSCDEILGISKAHGGSLVDFCAAVVDQKKGGEAGKMVEREDTGVVIDTCSAKATGKARG